MFSPIRWLRYLYRSRVKTYERKPRLRLCIEELENRITPTTTYTWTGAGGLANDTWNYNVGGVTNWLGDVVPPQNNSSAAVALVFPSGPANTTGTDNIPGLVVNSITFSGTNYSMGGTQTLTLADPVANTASIIVNTGDSGETLGMNIQLGTGVASSETLNVQTGATLAITGNLSGNSATQLTEEGVGTLTLSGNNNSFTGPFTISNTIGNGTVAITNANALGSAVTSDLQTLALANIGTGVNVTLTYPNGTTNPSVSFTYEGNSTDAGDLQAALNSLFTTDLGYGGSPVTVAEVSSGINSALFSIAFGGSMAGISVLQLTPSVPSPASASVNTLAQGDQPNVTTISDNTQLQVNIPVGAADTTVPNPITVVGVGTGSGDVGAIVRNVNDNGGGGATLSGKILLTGDTTFGGIAGSFLTITGMISDSVTSSVTYAGETTPGINTVLYLNPTEAPSAANDFQGGNFYHGNTNVDSGDLDVGQPFALGAGGAETFVNTNAFETGVLSLDFTNSTSTPTQYLNYSTVQTVSLTGATLNQTVTITGTGTFNLGFTGVAGTQTVTVTGSATSAATEASLQTALNHLLLNAAGPGGGTGSATVTPDGNSFLVTFGGPGITPADVVPLLAATTVTASATTSFVTQFTLGYNGATTAPITFSENDVAEAAAVQAALNGLTTVGTVGGNVSVTQSGQTFEVNFLGSLGGMQIPTLAANVTSQYNTGSIGVSFTTGNALGYAPIGFQIPDEYLDVGETELNNTAGDNSWQQPSADSATYAVTLSGNNHGSFVLSSASRIGVAVNTNLTFNGELSGTFEANGEGRIILPGPNNITSSILILEGEVNIRDSDALGGTSPIIEPVFESNNPLIGGSIELQADGVPDSSGLAGPYNLYFPPDVTFNLEGTGMDGEGALVNMSGQNVIAGQVILENDINNDSLPNASIGVAPDPDPTNVQHNSGNILSQLTIGGGSGTLDNETVAPPNGPGVLPTFTKTGYGELVLPDANNYSVGSGQNSYDTFVQQGWITVENDDALGAQDVADPLQTPGVDVESGASLVLKQDTNGNNLNIAYQMELSGTGISSRFSWLNQQGALINLDGTNTVSANIYLNGPAGIGVDIDGTVTPYSNPSQLLLTGIIYDGASPGELIKLGSQRLIIQGQGLYTGGVVIDQGVIQIQSDTALGTGTPTTDVTTTVESGAALELGTTVPDNNGGIQQGLQIWYTNLVLNGTGDPAFGDAPIMVESNDNMWRGPIQLNNTLSVTFQGPAADTAVPTILATVNSVNGTLSATSATTGAADIDAVQTLNFNNGFVAGDTFTLVVSNGTTTVQTGQISWSANTTTLIGNIQAALNAPSLEALFQAGVSFAQVALLDPVISIFPDTRLTVTGVISNGGSSAGLTVDGGGELDLAGDNTYTGNTFVQNGILTIQNASALGAGGVSQVQTITLSGAAANSTTFQLSFNGSMTPAITYTGMPADANTIAGYLDQLASIGGISGSASVSVNDSSLSSPVFTITLGGALSGYAQPEVNVVNLSGGSATEAITTTGTGGVVVSSGAQLQMEGGINVVGVPIILEGTGNPLESQVQTIDVNGPEYGTFQLSFTNPNPTSVTSTTASLPIGASAAQVQAALNALPSIEAGSGSGGGSVTVTENALDVYTVLFQGTFAGDSQPWSVQSVAISGSDTQTFNLGFTGYSATEPVMISGSPTSFATQTNLADALKALLENVESPGGGAGTASVSLAPGGNSLLVTFGGALAGVSVPLLTATPATGANATIAYQSWLTASSAQDTLAVSGPPGSSFDLSFSGVPGVPQVVGIGGSTLATQNALRMALDNLLANPSAPGGGTGTGVVEATSTGNFLVTFTGALAGQQVAPLVVSNPTNGAGAGVTLTGASVSIGVSVQGGTTNATPTSWFNTGSEETTGAVNLGSANAADIAGPVTSITTDPSDPNTLYIATAGGGVWKTNNANLGNDTTWTPVFGSLSTVQSFIVNGSNASTDSYTLIYTNPTTGQQFSTVSLPFNATAAQIQAALDTVVGAGNSVTVSQTVDSPGIDAGDQLDLNTTSGGWTANSSTFALTFNGVSTGEITYAGNANDDAADIAAALNAPGVLPPGGSVSVSVDGTSPEIFDITFGSSLGLSVQPALGYVPAGANTGSVTVTSAGSGPEFTNDVTFSGGSIANVNIAPLGYTTTGSATIAVGVSSITMTSGSGYTNPAVTINPIVNASGTSTGGSGATAHAVGAVTSVTLTAVGSGYTSAPTVTFSGGGGTGAAGFAVMNTGFDAGQVLSITITNPGSGYTTAPAVTLTGGGGSGATATASLGITGIVVTSPGSLYTMPPNVTITDPTGSGAAAAATLTDGAVSGISVTSGFGYSTAPTVTITDQANSPGASATGSGASAYSTISGSVQPFAAGDKLDLTNSGSDYFASPAVDFVNGGGYGAAAATTSDVTLSSITLTNAGAGYTSQPGVTITDPVTGTSDGAAAVVNFNAATDTITGITVTNVGQGFNITDPPQITITGGGAPTTVATASAVLSGSVTGVYLTAGYTTPTVSFTGGGGSGAAGTVSGVVTGVSISNPGSGYTAPPTVTFSAPPAGPGNQTAEGIANLDMAFITNATWTAAAGANPAFATITAQNNFVKGQSVTINDVTSSTAPNNGYDGTWTVASASPSSFTFDTNNNPGSYTGGTFTAIAGESVGTATNGEISDVYIYNPGSGYTSAPAVTFTAPGGHGNTATATATLSLSSVAITTAGSGYTSPPTVTFFDSNPTDATNATGYAVLGSGATAGKISQVVITSGTDYTSAPAVAIALGTPAINLLSTVNAFATGATATDSIIAAVTAVIDTDAGSDYLVSPLVSLAVSPVGAAEGGVNASTPVAYVQTPILQQGTDVDLSLTSGSLVDASYHGADLLFYGTGDGDDSTNSFAGSGVYMSIDGGDTWNLLTDPTLTNFAVPGNPLFGLAINQILFDPSTDNLYVATSDLETSTTPVTLTGITNGTDTVTGLSSTGSLSPGMLVTGTGIPGGTTIVSVPDNDTIILSQAATSSSNSVSLSFRADFAAGTGTTDSPYLPNPGVWRYNVTDKTWFNLTNVTSAARAGGTSLVAANPPVSSADPTTDPDTPGPDDYFWYESAANTFSKFSFPQADASWSSLALVNGYLYASLSDPTGGALDAAYTLTDPSTANFGSSPPTWYLDPGGGTDSRTENFLTFLSPDYGNIRVAAQQNPAGGPAASNPADNYVEAVVATAAGAFNEILQSTNGGASWGALGSPANYLDSNGAYADALATTSASTFFVGGTDDNVGYVFEYNGGGWNNISVEGGNGPHTDVLTMAANASGSELFVGTDGGIWEYTVGTQTWTDLNGNLDDVEYTDIVSNPTNPNSALGVGQGIGLLEYTGSQSWTQTGVTPATAGANADLNGSSVAIDPNNPSIMYEYQQGAPGGGSAKLFVSTNGGSTWTATPVSSGGQLNAPVVIDRLSRVFAGGATLQWLNPLLNPTTLLPNDHWVNLDSPIAVTAIAVAELQGPFVADSRFTDVTDLGATSPDPNTVYVTNGSQIAVTKDFGLDWATCSDFISNVALPAGNTITDIAVDPLDRDTIYATVSGPPGSFYTGTVWESTNAGKSWSLLNNGLPSAELTSVEVTNGGSGYLSVPSVTISAPAAGGTQATGYATISGGVVTGIVLTSLGSGYTAPPTVTISAPTGVGGTGANATALFSAISAWTIVIDPRTNLLYLGTDDGAYVYTPGTTGSWAPFGKNMPAVAVHTLDLNQTTNILTAGTDGLGAYQFFLDTPTVNSGALYAASGSDIWNGPIILAGPTTISASGAQTLQNGISLTQLTILGSISDATYAETQAGTNTLTKIGGGNVTFEGADTYGGTTLVSQGNLITQSPSALGGSGIAGTQELFFDNPLAGTTQFTLSFNGSTTGSITYTGDPATDALDIQDALNAATFPTIGGLAMPGSVQVAPNGAGVFLVVFGGSLANITSPLLIPTITSGPGAALSAVAGGTVVETGSILQLSGSLVGEPLFLFGNGVEDNGHWSGALENISGSNTYTGTITLESNATIGTDSSTALTITSASAGAPAITDLGTAGQFELTKEGAGSLTLTSADSYGGGTDVNQGILDIENGGALGGAGTTTVLDLAQLQLDDVNGPIDVTNQNLVLAGAGIDAAADPYQGALVNVNGNNTWGSPATVVTLADAPAFSPQSTPSGTVTVNIVDQTDTLTIGSPINEAPAMLQSGPAAPPAVPTLNAATLSGSGSSFSSGTYYYEITAVSAAGVETAPSNQIAVSVPAGEDVNLSWARVTGAASYNIYRTTVSGDYESPALVASVPALAPPGPAQMYSDTGTATQAYVPAYSLGSGLVKIGSGTLALTQSGGDHGSTYIQSGVISAQANDALGVNNGDTVERLTIVDPDALAAGNYRLTFNGDSTGFIAFRATASTVATDLDDLASIGAGGVTVSMNEVYSGISEVDSLTLTNPVASGPNRTAFELSYGGDTTPAITYTGNAVTDVQNITKDLDNLISIGGITPFAGTPYAGSVSVTADPTDTIFTITFGGALQDQSLPGDVSVTLTSGSGTGAASVARVQSGAGAPTDVYTITFVGTGLAGQPQPLITVTTLSGSETAATSMVAEGGVGVDVSSGAALDLDAASNMTSSAGQTLVLNGTGINNTGALVNVAGDNTWDGPLTLQTSSTINTEAGTELTVAGPVQDPTPLTNPGAPGNLTKIGTGELVFPSADTYSGSTFIDAGILNAQSATALGFNTSAEETLTVSGTSGSFTLGFAAPISPSVNTGPITTSTLSVATFDTALATMMDNASAPGADTGTATASVNTAGTVWTITFGGRLAGVAVPLLTVQSEQGNTIASVAPLLSGGISSTIVASGAALQLQSNTGFSEDSLKPLTLSGTGVNNGGALENVSGNNTWAATPITLGSNVNLGADGTSQLMIGQAIGDGGLGFGVTKVGSGTVVYSGTAANTYTGLTDVTGGTLDLDKSASVLAVAGNLAVGDTTSDPEQILTLSDYNNGDQFTLTFQGTPTGDILYTDTGNPASDGATNAASMASALGLILPAGGTVNVTPTGIANQFLVVFGGTIAGSLPPLMTYTDVAPASGTMTVSRAYTDVVEAQTSSQIDAAAALTILDDGQFNVGTTSQSVGSIGMTGGDIDIGTGGDLTISGGLTATSDATAPALISGAGTLTLGSLNPSFDINPGGQSSDLVISAVVSGTDGFTKQGAGQLEIATGGSYGTTTSADGNVQVDAGAQIGAVTLAGGSLSGEGTVGSITSTSILSPAPPVNTVSPGYDDPSTGILTVDGNVSWSSGTTFSVALTDDSLSSTPVPGTDYDQLDVTGSVALGNALLSGSVAANVQIGDSFTIIQAAPGEAWGTAGNELSTLISGGSSPVGQSGYVFVDGKTFMIDYDNADGKVILTRAEDVVDNFTITASTTAGPSPSSNGSASSTYGQDVVYTAEIQLENGATLQSGTEITFTLDGGNSVTLPVTPSVSQPNTGTATYDPQDNAPNLILTATGSPHEIDAEFFDTTNPANLVTAYYSPAGPVALQADEEPFVQTVTASPTETAAADVATDVYSLQQSLPLSAEVSPNPPASAVSPAVTVNEGTVTFSVWSNYGTPSATQIGLSVGPISVSGNMAVANGANSYILPANTPAGTYTILASYNDPGGNFQGGSDSTHTLTLNPAVSMSALPNGDAGLLYDHSISVTGGTAPYTITVPASSFSFDATSLNTFASLAGNLQFLAFDPSGNLYVSNSSAGTISKITPAGAVSTFIPASDGLVNPNGIAFDSSGNMYVADFGNDSIAQFNATTGALITLDYASISIAGPSGLAFDSSGNLWVASYDDGTVNEYLSASSFTSSNTYNVGSGPEGLAFDSSGNLYVANRGSNTISEISTLGVPSTFASGLNQPNGLAFDAVGNLYVANQGNNTISEITPAGAVSTLVSSSSLDQPYGLAFDSSGSLYIANFNSTDATIDKFGKPYLSYGSLSVTANGVTLDGTSSLSGTVNFTVDVTDASGLPAPVASKSYSVVINPDMTFSPPSSASLYADVGSLYTQAIQVQNGTQPYTHLTISGFNAHGTGLVAPSGAQINVAAGTITFNSTPTASGSVTFTVSATDSAGAVVSSGMYTITVNPALAISAPAGGDVGVAYDDSLTVTGGTAPYTDNVAAFSFNANGTGLTAPTWNGTNAFVFSDPSGPTNPGTATLTVSITDSAGVAGVTLTKTYNIVVSAQPTLSPASPLSADVGVALGASQTVAVSGGTAPYTVLTVSGFNGGTTGLIAGDVTANASTGKITFTGTPTGAGNAQTGTPASFTIKLTDTAGYSQSYSYTLDVNPALSMSPLPANLPEADVGTTYGEVIDVTGGTTPYGATTFVGSFNAGGTGLSAPTLGNGTITFNSTPTAAGTATFTVKTTDAVGGSITLTYNVVVNAALDPNPTTLPDADATVPYSQTITITGGTRPFTTFSVTDFSGGTTGLTSSAVTTSTSGSGASTTYTVTVSGTPAASGSASFHVNITDGIGVTLTESYTLTVNPAMTITASPLPSGDVGTLYNQAIQLAGGTAPYTSLAISNWNAGGTGLVEPSGAQISLSSGSITFNSTPTASGTVKFTVSAADSASGGTITQNYTLVINKALTITPTSLPAGDATVNYDQTVTVANGTGPYTITVPDSDPNAFNAGTTGLTYGEISVGANSVTIDTNGTPPTAQGTATFTVNVTDAAGGLLTENYTIDINPALAASTIPGGDVGVLYNRVITVSGGTTPYAMSIPASGVGSFNAGGTGLVAPTIINSGATHTVSFNSTPTHAGTATFTLNVSDAAGGTLSVPYSVVVSPDMTISPATLPLADANSPYSATVSLSNGSAPYTITVPSSGVGAFNAGTTGLTYGDISIGASGVSITGTPSAAGTATFTVNATDAAGATLTKSYTITVNPPMTISPLSAPAADIGRAYKAVFTVTGGSAPFSTFTLNGTFNAGGTGLTTPTLVNSGSTHTVTFNSTPSALGSGSASFTLTAVDAAGVTLTQTYTIDVNSALTVGPASLPAATYETAYTPQTIQFDNPLTNLTVTGFNVAGLGGMSYSTNAASGQVVIQGTPTGVPATTSFTVTGTDTAGAVLSKVYTLIVNKAGTSVSAVDETATFGTANQVVSLSATINSVVTVNEGRVYFEILNASSHLVGSEVSGPVVGGTATANYTLPANTPAANYTILATYVPLTSGAHFTGNTDNTHTLTVNKAAATIAAVNTVAYYGAASVVLTADVTSAAGVVNQGTVTFELFNGVTLVGTATTSATVTNGKASVNYALPTILPAGTVLTIVATYNPGVDYTAPNPTDNTHTVTILYAVSMAVKSSANPSLVNNSVTFTITLSSPTGTIADLVGQTVTVMNGSTVLGTAAINSLGVATFSHTFTVAEAYKLTFVFGGDDLGIGDAFAAQTATFTQTVETKPVVLR